jgi:hypothetical protein
MPPSNDIQVFTGHIQGPVLAWTDGSRSAAVRAGERDVVIIARPPLAGRFRRRRELTIAVVPNRSAAAEAQFVAVSIE